MKKWADSNEEVFFSFPVDGKEICAACFLDSHELDKEAMDSMKEVPAHGVCDCCGERFDSDRAEEGNEEVVVLAFM